MNHPYARNTKTWISAFYFAIRAETYSLKNIRTICHMWVSCLRKKERIRLNSYKIEIFFDVLKTNQYRYRNSADQTYENSMALVACESVQVISIVCVAWVLSISGTFLVSFKWRFKEICLIFPSNISDVTGNDLVFPKKKKELFGNIFS